MNINVPDEKRISENKHINNYQNQRFNNVFNQIYV